MKIFSKISYLLVISLLVFCTACVETVVVGSVATGTLALRDKTLSDTGKDTVIATKLTGELLANGLKNPGNSVDFDVNEGRVLLIGIVRDAKKANLATDLAWKIPNVKEVIDEIQLKDDFRLRDISSSFGDYVITATLETKLLFTKGVSSVNYKITTVGRSVYILGVSANHREMDKVLSVASRVRGVERVINHIVLVDDRRRDG